MFCPTGQSWAFFYLKNMIGLANYTYHPAGRIKYNLQDLTIKLDTSQYFLTANIFFQEFAFTLINNQA